LKAAIAGSNQLIKKVVQLIAAVLASDSNRLLKKRFSPRLVKNIRMKGARRKSATKKMGVFQQPAVMKRVDPPAFKTSRMRTSLA
jgi:hypothetical protein